MTLQQVYLFTGLYGAALVVVLYFTRATVRRTAAALVGAVAVSAIALAADRLGEMAGLWRMAIWGARLLPLVYVGFVISIAPIYLVTWRIARRFGSRGLAIAMLVLAVIGPPRDYTYMARYPEWGSYASGVAPILAVAALYAVLIPVGHACMRLIAGPPEADPLARRWFTSE